MDLKLYVDADPDLRFIRRLKRDIVDRGRTAESVITQYLETVRPMHLQHIHPTRKYSDLLVDCSGSLDQVLHQINAAIHAACCGLTATKAPETRETIGVR
jgi:uridine kinase